MKIVQLTNDNREIWGQYTLTNPLFGTAPQGLLDGFKLLPAHEVHVVCATRKPVESPMRLAANIFYHSVNVPSFGMMKTAYIPTILAVRKKIQEIHPDIVHGQGTERDCSMCAVFSGFPNVLTIHGNMRVHASRPATASSYYRMAALLESLCLRRTNGVVAISSYTRGLVSGLAKKSWLLPNAVDPTFFDAKPTPPPIPRFLFVGSLTERKNPLALINALRELLLAGEATVAFAGEGYAQDPYFQNLEEAARDLPGVSFLGFLARDALRSEFEKATALILPTHEDNCPMVVLEAQAAGIPVAASAVGGVPDLIQHRKTGLLFDPANQTEISNSIKELLHRVDLRASLAAAGKKYALENYHPKVVAQRHIEIYNEVIASKR